MKQIRHCKLFCAPLVALWCCSLAAPAWGEYKVILKDGTVMESRIKPVSMQGDYRFTGADSRFYVIPADQVDQEATRAANATSDSSGKPKVFTNEDVSTGTSAAAPRPADDPVESTAPGERSSADMESFWRGEANKLQAQITEVDRQIATIEGLVAQQGFQVLSCPPGDPYCYTSDRTNEIKRLQATKQQLEQDFAALEERGRKAGALPGWFRGGTIEPMAPSEAGESYWRGEARKLRDQIAELDQEIAAVRQAIQEHGASEVKCPSDDPARNNCVMTDRVGELAVLEANKKKLESDFADLETRGRQAGALPGWFR
jgi:hypothetical protein